MDPPATGRGDRSRSDDPYDGLDVDPYGRTHARVDSNAFRKHIPKEVLEDDRIPIDPHTFNNGDKLWFRIGVSKEVPGRIILDLDRSQLPTPPER